MDADPSEAETPLTEGKKARVGIETVQNGYAFVIDREQYTDGMFGVPNLIFPTLEHEQTRIKPPQALYLC
jgi:hypothetical protein